MRSCLAIIWFSAKTAIEAGARISLCCASLFRHSSFIPTIFQLCLSNHVTALGTQILLTKLKTGQTPFQLYWERWPVTSMASVCLCPRGWWLHLKFTWHCETELVGTEDFLKMVPMFKLAGSRASQMWALWPWCVLHSMGSSREVSRGWQGAFHPSSHAPKPCTSTGLTERERARVLVSPWRKQENNNISQNWNKAVSPSFQGLHFSSTDSLRR